MSARSTIRNSKGLTSKLSMCTYIFQTLRSAVKRSDDTNTPQEVGEQSKSNLIDDRRRVVDVCDSVPALTHASRGGFTFQLRQ